MNQIIKLHSDELVRMRKKIEKTLSEADKYVRSGDNNLLRVGGTIGDYRAEMWYLKAYSFYQSVDALIGNNHFNGYEDLQKRVQQSLNGIQEKFSKLHYRST